MAQENNKDKIIRQGVNDQIESTPSVAAIREQYMQEMERVKENYKKASDDNRIKMKDPNRQYVHPIPRYKREDILRFVEQPASNEYGLREVARYLYFRSNIFYRLLHWYSSMWDLRCRKVTPSYSLVKENNKEKILRQYENTLNKLEVYNIHNNWGEVALRCYLEDVCYAVFFRDKQDAFFYILDPNECRIDGRYFTGDLSYSIDMSKWRNSQRRELASWLGSPFVEMLAEYDEYGTRWVHMPDKYAACFKFNIDRLDTIITPFAGLLIEISNMLDVGNIQSIKDEQSIYKLLLLPMKTLASAKVSDEFEISPDLLLKYYDKLLNILPEYIAAAPIPGELTNDNVIDFSTTSIDKDLDRLRESQTTLLSTSGGGAVLNATQITSTAAFNAFLMFESEYAISTLLPQIEGFTNRMLRTDVVGTPCTVKYFEVTVYTKDKLKESLLTSCQYSFSNRIAYNTLNGVSEKETLAMEYLETEILDLPGLMNHPLQSSYTQSGEVGQGRDPLPDDEIEGSTERTRNA